MRPGTTLVSPATSAGKPAEEAAQLPFDYTAVFPLRGERGNVVQDVIDISAESDFVAVGISYGFQASHVAPVAPIMPRMNFIFSSVGTAPRDLLISTFRSTC